MFTTRLFKLWHPHVWFREAQALVLTAPRANSPSCSGDLWKMVLPEISIIREILFSFAKKKNKQNKKHF